jgi:HPt (histidine-containing phosphotransfer) domain-containing protein
MDDYVAKPVDEQVLYGKIVSLVKKSGITDKQKKNETNSIEKVTCTDLSYLMIRTKSNSKLMMEMIALYLEHTPLLISAMKKGLKEKDWKLLYSAAHKIIPSFAIMGMSADYENMAKKVQEFASTQQHFEGVPSLVVQLENICLQACEELKEEYNILKVNL